MYRVRSFLLKLVSLILVSFEEIQEKEGGRRRQGVGGMDLIWISGLSRVEFGGLVGVWFCLDVVM